MRNNNPYLKTPSPHPTLLPGLNFTPSFLYLLLQSCAGKWGMGVAVSSSHIILCCSLLLILFPCSSVGLSHRRQSSMKVSNVGLHKLLQHRCCPRGAVLQAHPPALLWGPLWAAGEYLLHRGRRGLHGLQGYSLLHQGLHHGLQGNL